MADELYVIEGPGAVREGEILNYAVVWSGAQTVSSGITSAYRNGSDVSATVLSGSDTITGQTQVLKVLTVPAGYGGSRIVLEVLAVVDGNTIKVGRTLKVLKAGEEG